MPNMPLELTCRELKLLRDAGEALVLLDVRESDERAVAAIPGDRWLPMSEIVQRVGELAGREADRVVVYCHVGGRSLRVAQWLREQGFAGAQSMAGGIDEWVVDREESTGDREQ